MSFHLSGELFRTAFGTAELRDIFDQDGFIAAFQEVEAALARAEAEAGLIPEDAAEEITAKADPSYVDEDKLAEAKDEIGLFTMAIIETWKDAFDGAGEYIHWGATSQDISDTAVVLQLRAAHEVFCQDLSAITDELADLATTYRDQPMIGRTHHVHATPITFGLKAATWLDELQRELEHLRSLEDQVFVLEFFGATGTLASLGEDGPTVQRNLSAELDLPLPDVAWFVARDRFATYLDCLARIATTLERFAKQILVSNRPEIGELEEPIPEGEIGSSTMPHKRNPVKSERTVALAKLVRSQATVMRQAMAGYDERDFGTWYAEFAAIPEACIYLGRMLTNVRETVTDLQVNTDRMEENLDIYGPLVTSEAVMMALAERVGRQTAHDIVHETAMTALQSDQSFRDVLREDERIAAEFTDDELEALTDHHDYVGQSAAFVDRAVDNRR